MQGQQVKIIKFNIKKPQNNANLIDKVGPKVDLKFDVSWSCSGIICPDDEAIVEHFNLDVNFANG